jgi:hypothetical protein
MAIVLSLPLLAACSNDDSAPAWARDPGGSGGRTVDAGGGGGVDAGGGGGVDAARGVDAGDGGGVDAARGGDSGGDSAAPADTGAGDTGIADTGGGDGGRDYSTDRNKFFGASRCAQANVQLCEDFESDTLDQATWTVSGPAPVIDGVQAARGNKALHITVDGNGGSNIAERKTFPEPNNTYFGRVFVWFDKLPGPPLTYAHWTFIAASGTDVSGEIRVSGQFQNGKNLFGVGTDNSVDPQGTGDWTNSDNDPNGAPMAVPTKQWLCIEWLHKGDTNETRFWWDATEHPSLYTSMTVHGGNNNPYILPQFTRVWLGWAEYQGTNEPFELWMDEIAIDKERIGCVL